MTTSNTSGRPTTNKSNSKRSSHSSSTSKTTQSSTKQATKKVARGSTRTTTKTTTKKRSTRSSRTSTGSARGRKKQSQGSIGRKEVTSKAFLTHRNNPRDAQEVRVKKGEEPVRLYALGGLEEIGVNMMFFEYKGEIIVIDAGLQFAEAHMHGVQYLIPDISYLKKRKDKIKAIFITHGHLDHIGALRHILEPLDWPLIYTTPLTLGLIKKLFDDKRKLKNLKYKIVNPDVDIVKEGPYTVEFFRVNHNIPETMGMAIHTPKGLVVNTADFKIDHTPAIDKPADMGKISRIGQEGVKLMLCESTNATKPGHTKSERVIGETLDSIIKNTPGRQIVSTFASNVGRIIQLIESAVRYNKVVFLAGRSMVNNVELCQELGYINVPKNMVRKVGPEIESLPDNRVMVLCTGSQGEQYSALVRMATDEFRFFTLKPGDNIILSTHTIPGNEGPVINMLNKLVKKDVNIIDDSDLDIHSSGHGYQGDIKTMMSMLRPNYYCPIHGEPLMRHANKQIALQMNIPEEHILLPENGYALELYDGGIKISRKKLKLDTMMVDGKGVGHLSGEYVIKARQIMAEDGIINLVFKVDAETRDLVGNIQIESRGFVYSSEVKKIHTKIVEFARKKYNAKKKNKKLSVKDILRKIKDDLSGYRGYISRLIGREPMVVPMFVYISRDGEEEDDFEDSIVGMTLEEQGYSD